MVIGLIGFALIAGITLYVKFRSFNQAELWRYHHRISQAEIVNHRLPIPKLKPVVWDYSLGIPPWNPALMIVNGFNPRTYRPQPGDSDSG